VVAGVVDHYQAGTDSVRWSHVDKSLGAKWASGIGEDLLQTSGNRTTSAVSKLMSEAKQITLTVDGKSVTVPGGTTVLQACEQADSPWPLATMCGQEFLQGERWTRRGR
jgi:hypothetical protein